VSADHLKLFTPDDDCPVCDEEILDPVTVDLTGEGDPEEVCRGCRDDYFLDAFLPSLHAG
jgi:hypothetical protein